MEKVDEEVARRIRRRCSSSRSSKSSIGSGRRHAANKCLAPASSSLVSMAHRRRSSAKIAGKLEEVARRELRSSSSRSSYGSQHAANKCSLAQASLSSTLLSSLSPQQQQQQQQQQHSMSSSSRPTSSRPSSSSFGGSDDEIGGGGGQKEVGVGNKRQRNRQQQMPTNNQMNIIKSTSRAHNWHWDSENKSHQCILSDDKLQVCFHPQCSESTAAIRGSEPLKRDGNYYYWELTVFDKTFGTSVMFGLCTKQQSLHANNYFNLIGLDRNGWSLSHKGHIMHDGKIAKYTQEFPTNQTITLGLLFDTMRGELSYFMDGQNLGVAFCGLNNIEDDLYPVIGSTAKCTKMRLDGAYCGYVSLMERSCFTILKSLPDKLKLLDYLKENRVPGKLVNYLAELAEVCGSGAQATNIY